MTDLIIASKIPGLTMDEERALEARNETRIKGIHEGDMSGPLKEMISNALFIAGQQPLSPEELTMMTVRLIEDLKCDFRQYTLSEISHAISLGCKEKLGEYKNVSVRQIIRWLNTYGTKIKREANVKFIAWQERQEREKEKSKEEEKLRLFEEFIIGAYNEFKIGDIYEDVYQVANIFSYLKKKDKIPLDDKDIEDIESLVRVKYQERRDQLPETFAEKAMRKQRGDEWKRYQETEIKTRVKAEALIMVFTKWKQQNYKLEL